MLFLPGMCAISPEQSDSARQRIKTLPLTEHQLWKAVTALPFSLTEAAVFFQSMQHKVTFEVEAVLIFKNTCAWLPKHRFRLSEIVTAVSQTEDQELYPNVSTPCAEVGKLPKARRQFTELGDTLRKAGMTLKASRLNIADQEAAVAVAFLACPERVVWHRGDQDPACFLGEELVDCKEQGYSVGVLFKRSGKGLQCSLHLPCTDWVFRSANIKKLIRTFKFLSDSTVLEFRVACIMKLRSFGYDMRLWQCHGGFQQTQFAVDITPSKKIDLRIIFPNRSLARL